jgi:glucose/arabinose dehydrogenase
MKLKHLTLTFLTLSLAIILAPKATKAATLSVVSDKLDNPRGTAFGPDGSLYIAETGRGGDGKDGRCIPSPSSQFIPLCAGDTGSLIRITPEGKQETILSSLPSLALTPSGEQGAGPADIKFDSKGDAYLLMGYAGNPETRETVLKTPLLGQLLKVDLTPNR